MKESFQQRNLYEYGFVPHALKEVCEIPKVHMMKDSCFRHFRFYVHCSEYSKHFLSYWYQKLNLVQFFTMLYKVITETFK